MQYINYNGSIHHQHEPLLPVTNRGFRYGDGFFESMIMFNKKIPLLEYHWSRIEFTATVLSAVLPSRLDAEKLMSLIHDLCAVNDLVTNARVRIQFFRMGDGLYLPDEEKLGYVISMEKVENERFEAGAGLAVGLREDCFKPVSMTSDLKTSNALNYVLAAQFAKAEGWDDLIMLNMYSQVCEAIHYNVFLFKDNKFITPDLDSGCVNGVMRSCLLSLLGDSVEERDVEVTELETADEIILTNSVKGIQWVKAFGGKSYQGAKASELSSLLNSSLLGVNR
jgi:branched-subunit amino acid aminotransferase/4-amino-4-deoxychorismate lyase